MTTAVRRTCLLTVGVCALFQTVYLPALTHRPDQLPPPAPVAPLPSPELDAADARLEVDPPRYDFGMVAMGQEVRYNFTVTNRGEGPARVARVWSTCGCTVSNIGKEQLQPGESTELKVVFTGKAPGPFHKSVFVSLAPPLPSLRIDLTGTVRP